MIDEITNYHSSYYVDDSQAPAPLLMSSGFTDDLFPVDEVIRFYNRTRANYPNTPMSIFAGSFGHARGQFQANVERRAAGTRRAVDRPLPDGRRPAAGLRGDHLHPDLPERHPRKRSLHGGRLGIPDPR